MCIHIILQICIVQIYDMSRCICIYLYIHRDTSYKYSIDMDIFLCIQKVNPSSMIDKGNGMRAKDMLGGHSLSYKKEVVHGHEGLSKPSPKGFEW